MSKKGKKDIVSKFHMLILKKKWILYNRLNFFPLVVLSHSSDVDKRKELVQNGCILSYTHLE